MYVPYKERQSRIPVTTRRVVMQRCEGRCERCGGKVPVFLHHRHYRTLGEEQPEDLLALCKECHGSAHRDEHGLWWNDPEEMVIFWYGDPYGG